MTSVIGGGHAQDELMDQCLQKFSKIWAEPFKVRFWILARLILDASRRYTAAPGSNRFRRSCGQGICIPADLELKGRSICLYLQTLIWLQPWSLSFDDHFYQELSQPDHYHHNARGYAFKLIGWNIQFNMCGGFL